MLNYDIDPSVLAPFVPGGTELDTFGGRTIVSIVGFLFLDTRVFGFPIPFHRNFEEVNLRFYVRRRTGDGWRRAVVFIKEIVPRFAIAATARAVYGEKYVAVPMGHHLQLRTDSGEPLRDVAYTWRIAGRGCSIRMSVRGEPREIEAGSEAEFITEHYWGYSRRRDGRTLEYQVAHARWRAWFPSDASFDGEVAETYGREFVAPLGGAPASAFLADGSAVTVYRGRLLA